jgi:hypothetical protein
MAALYPIGYPALWACFSYPRHIQQYFSLDFFCRCGCRPYGAFVIRVLFGREIKRGQYVCVSIFVITRIRGMGVGFYERDLVPRKE